MKQQRNGKALVLTRQQIREVVEELSYPHSAIAQLCYWTASRQGEIIRLTWDAIGPEAMSIRQTKTSQTKSVRLFPQLEEVIKTMEMHHKTWCFPGRGHGPISVRAYEKMLAQRFDWLGIQGASSHSFRRSMATHLYHSGVDLESIRQRTGHKSLASLTEYIDIPALTASAAIESAIANWDD